MLHERASFVDGRIRALPRVRGASGGAFLSMDESRQCNLCNRMGGGARKGWCVDNDGGGKDKVRRRSCHMGTLLLGSLSGFLQS